MCCCMFVRPILGLGVGSLLGIAQLAPFWVCLAPCLPFKLFTLTSCFQRIHLFWFYPSSWARVLFPERENFCKEFKGVVPHIAAFISLFTDFPFSAHCPQTLGKGFAIVIPQTFLHIIGERRRRDCLGYPGRLVRYSIWCGASFYRVLLFC